jgi:hypothetical protein
MRHVQQGLKRAILSLATVQRKEDDVCSSNFGICLERWQK